MNGQSLVSDKNESTSEEDGVCVVCHETGAKMHYGVLSCLGCKGFFRRALKRADQYECLHRNQCVIDKVGRTACRSCRFNKCLEVGMDPAAVRPDRDNTHKHLRLRKQNSGQNLAAQTKKIEMRTISTNAEEDWYKKLSVEMRTLLMNLLNVEIKVSRGDTTKNASSIYPLQINTIKEVIDDPVKLAGKRTEMRYEPYRLASNEELLVIVYRRLIAAIDWVAHLTEMIGGLSTNDQIALVKCCYGPLLLLKCAARTAMVTQNDDILCLCNFAYVPRNISKTYNDPYHLDNGVVDRAITELVYPFRNMQIREEELVCLSAIIVMNPLARDLSEEAIEKVSKFRNQIQETLFYFIKEMSSDNNVQKFGNYLLALSTITNLADILCENIRFAQTFSALGSYPLLTSVFGCFPLDPFDIDKPHSSRTTGTQTDSSLNTKNVQGVKRRLPSSFVSPVENDPVSDRFCLLQPPGSYTLTEMFEDRMSSKLDDNTISTPSTHTWAEDATQRSGTNFENFDHAGPSQQFLESHNSDHQQPSRPFPMTNTCAPPIAPLAHDPHNPYVSCYNYEVPYSRLSSSHVPHAYTTGPT